MKEWSNKKNGTPDKDPDGDADRRHDWEGDQVHEVEQVLRQNKWIFRSILAKQKSFWRAWKFYFFKKNGNVK